MSELPRGWESIAIRDVAKPTPGSLTDGPFGSNLKTEHYVSTPGPRVIRLQNIGDLAFNGDDEAFITQEHFQSLRRHEVHPGDVLIAGMGDILPRVCLAPPGIEPAIVKADCFRLSCRDGIDSRFVQYALSAPQLRRAASTQISGVGRPRLNLGKVGSLTIPLPPTAEQKRIVAAIEEEFSRLDAGVAALERVQQNLKRLRAAAHLRLDRAATESVSPQPLASHAGFIVDGEHNPPKRFAEGIPYLTAKHVKNGQVLSGNATFISANDFETVRRRYDPRPGDVLVTCVGTLGEVAVVPDGLAFAADRNLAAIRPNRDVNPIFLASLLRAPRQQKLLTAGSGSTAQPHLYLKDLRALPVPIPDPPRQAMLLQELKTDLELIERVEKGTDVNLVRIGVLRTTILAAAFSGKLAPQHPTDEPAFTILDRIADERVSSNGYKPARNRKSRTARAKVPE